MVLFMLHFSVAVTYTAQQLCSIEQHLIHMLKYRQIDPLEFSMVHLDKTYEILKPMRMHKPFVCMCVCVCVCVFMCVVLQILQILMPLRVTSHEVGSQRTG